MKRKLLIYLSILPLFFCPALRAGIVCRMEPASTTATVVILSAVCPPAAVAVAIGEVVALDVVAFGVYYAHKKSQHNKRYERYPVYNVDFCSCGGKPPKHEDNEKEHPHGIYEEAGYHHKNSAGGKSTCPNNGQKALDNSFKIEGNDRQRIALDEDQFVVLYQSSVRRFHGHVREWGRLDQAMRNTLVNQGLVRDSGKIIRRM